MNLGSDCVYLRCAEVPLGGRHATTLRALPRLAAPRAPSQNTRRRPSRSRSPAAARRSPFGAASALRLVRRQQVAPAAAVGPRSAAPSGAAPSPVGGEARCVGVVVVSSTSGRPGRGYVASTAAVLDVVLDRGHLMVWHCRGAGELRTTTSTWQGGTSYRCWRRRSGGVTPTCVAMRCGRWKPPTRTTCFPNASG